MRPKQEPNITYGVSKSNCLPSSRCCNSWATGCKTLCKGGGWFLTLRCKQGDAMAFTPPLITSSHRDCPCQGHRAELCRGIPQQDEVHCGEVSVAPLSFPGGLPLWSSAGMVRIAKLGVVCAPHQRCFSCCARLGLFLDNKRALY